MKHTLKELSPEEFDALYSSAERLLGENTAALRAMALYAYEQRREAEAMRILSWVWGRNARLMAWAVARYPAEFMERDGNPPQATEADQLLALFEMCKLSREEARTIYQNFKRFGLRAWQVRDRVLEKQALRRTNVRANLRRVRLSREANRLQIEIDPADIAKVRVIDPRKPATVYIIQNKAEEV